MFYFSKLPLSTDEGISVLLLWTETRVPLQSHISHLMATNHMPMSWIEPWLHWWETKVFATEPTGQPTCKTYTFQTWSWCYNAILWQWWVLYIKYNIWRNIPHTGTNRNYPTPTAGEGKKFKPLWNQTPSHQWRRHRSPVTCKTWVKTTVILTNK